MRASSLLETTPLTPHPPHLPPNAYSYFELRCHLLQEVFLDTSSHHTHPCSVVAPAGLQWIFSEFVFPTSLEAAEGSYQVLDIFYLSMDRFLRKEGWKKGS